ncbi:MAG: hypothetical protein PHC30_10485 [Lentisphaeria bacterium]|nr:hypothetical protein [Lentisphaeria bacterium]
MPVAQPDQVNVPVAAPAPVNVPVAQPDQVNVPVAQPDQVNVPVAAPAPVNVPVAAPAEVNVPVAAPAEKTIQLDSRPWLSNIRPNLKPEGPDGHGIVSAVSETSNYSKDSGVLGQMLSEIQRLNKHVFVVKGA